MKKVLFLFLLLGAAVAFAQPAPVPTPGAVVVPVPDPIVAWAAAAFVVGGMIYKALDGLKNFIPSLKDNPTLIKILNFAGNFIIVGGGCFVVGQVHDAFDLLKCVGAAVMGSLVSAGFYDAKKASDIARAGGAAPLTNAKAVAEVQTGTPAVPIPPAAKGSK